MIVISGFMKVPAEHRDEFLGCLRELQNATREKDPGLGTYRFTVDIEDDCNFQVYEEWETVEHLKTHGKAAHMQPFREARQRLNVETYGFSRFRAEDLGEF